MIDDPRALRRNCLDDAGRRRGWDNARQRETRLIQECFVLVRCALTPSGDEQHGDICELAGEWRVARRNDLFDHEQFGGGRRGLRYRAPAFPQNCRGTVVVPVMNDILQHIRITTDRHGLEEIARDTITAVSKAFRAQALLRAFDHRRLIEKDGGCPRAGLEDRRDQRAMPTAHVYDPRTLPETVCIDDSSGVLSS